MAVTILQRPEGHVLSTTENTATVSESYGAGDAQFVSPTVHGLTDGDYIYAESDIENYAGFWYVDVISTGIFKIKPYPNGDYVQFINSGSITWFASTLTHGWSAVHLPITYRISTDLYPLNSADTTRTITSVTDSNGYSVIHLSGSLGSGVNSYDFVKITAPSDTDLSKVYQILEFISPTVMIINLAYDSTNNFTSATALKHYNNYNFIVRVYAGINASHEWALQKPYELAATLQFTPDDNNEAFFSINEILKSYIETRNNLTLGTLPNNIDFWTNFYIKTAESYDDSDGYVFGTFTSNYTSDQSEFEGTAANSKLEFKNLHSGYLSDYVSQPNAGQFLTLFSRGKVFSGTYHDISFIYSSSNSLQFENRDFTDNLTDWSSFDGSDRSSEKPFVWAAGQAFADAEFDAINLTKYFAQTRPGGWPEGTFTITICAENSSVASAFFTMRVFGMMNSSTQTEQTVIGTVTFNRNAGVICRTISFTTTQVWTYLAFAFDNVTDGIVVGIESVNIDSFVTAGSIVFREEYYLNGNLGTTVNTTIAGNNYIDGIYRTEITEDCAYDRVDVSVHEGADQIIQTHTLDIDCTCANQEIPLTWLNNLGGFDYWNFTAKKDHIVEIQEAMTTKKNILPTWPKSYGSQADTIRKQTLRVSNKAYTVRSQHLTLAEADAISYIHSSVLVQIISSRTDRRTVIVDTDSFVIRKDGDKTFEAIFNISFTDDIPVQSA